MHATQSKGKGIVKLQPIHRKPLRIALIGGYMHNALHLVERGETAARRGELS
jgi:hypothetical protein